MNTSVIINNNLVEKALEVAIEAHKGQVRKAEKDKPYIVHPIRVAEILKQYSNNQELVAAGYLHDVLEDTDYKKEKLLELFGDRVVDFIKNVTEPDKNLSWEERKQQTIDRTSCLSLENKLLVCADKISNLEDLQIIFHKKGYQDFSSFKRGKELQKWYYDGIYDSLISDNHPMFSRLKELMLDVFRDDFISYPDYYKGLEILKLGESLGKNVSIFSSLDNTADRKNVQVWLGEELLSEYLMSDCCFEEILDSIIKSLIRELNCKY